jgi:hypothetical protein
MSDIGCRRKDYSDIRYYVGLCALQSDIGRSDIRLSPISLITDIGLSAHLWLHVHAQFRKGKAVRRHLLGEEDGVVLDLHYRVGSNPQCE